MTGLHRHNIDAKGRLFIPAKLREELGSTFHVTIGEDGCLAVFSDKGWANFMNKVGQLPYSKAKQLRRVFAYAADCEPDGQGRILLPATLRDKVQLEKEVVITGSFDRVEIWPAQRWDALEAEEDEKPLEQIMEELGL